MWQADGVLDTTPEKDALLFHYREWGEPKGGQDRLQDSRLISKFGQALLDRMDKALANLATRWRTRYKEDFWEAVLWSERKRQRKKKKKKETEGKRKLDEVEKKRKKFANRH